MSDDPLTIPVDPDSELGRALADLTDRDIVLLRGDTRFRVIREHDDPWSGYDPDRVRAGLRQYAGMLAPGDADRMKEAIYRRREEGSRPLHRP